MESNEELRYQRLRSLCDKEKYLEPFDYSSLELVEKLIKDIIIMKKRINKNEQKMKEMNNRIDYLILGINAYKIQNIELYKENNELHDKIIYLNNKLSFNGKDIEFNKLKDDKYSLNFLLAEANKKIETLYHQLNLSKKKYIELIENLYKRNIESPKILDELTKEYRVKLDPNIYDFDKYELELEKDNKILNSPNDYNLYYRKIKENNYTFLEEKCKNLEIEIKNKNKEIEILKNNMIGNNKEEQGVVIDYLKNKMREEKIKYENYLYHALNENKKLLKKQQKIENEKKERRKKFGINAALKNFNIDNNLTKIKKTFSENKNRKIKNKYNTNKTHNKIALENNFLI